MSAQLEWRDIPGYGGRYQALSDGTAIRSLIWQEPKLLTFTPDSGGYFHVSLWAKGAKKPKAEKVHRLIARTFHGESYFPGAVVRHLDGSRTNNHPSNLAWGTHVENMQDRIAHGRNPWVEMTHCKFGHELTPENTFIRKKTGHRRCRECKRRTNREFMRLKYRQKRIENRDGSVTPTNVTPTTEPENEA